jgi:RNA polymerase sigma-70 factor (ECF subfamily)
MFSCNEVSFFRIYRQAKINDGGDNLNDIERAYKLHAQDVYKYLLSLSHDEDLAEELTQETFFRAMRTIGNYNGSCKLSVWLCQIAKHLWYQWLSKRTRHKQVELTNEIKGGESPEHSTVLHGEKTALYKIVHSLPEPMRELVHMRLTGEFTFAEIGEILGKNENWARTTFYRAKQKIIERMERF